MQGILVHEVAQNLRGRYKAEVYEGDIILDRHGRPINKKLDQFEKDNLVVTVGKQMILDRLYALSAVGAVTRMGVGTSNTAAAVGNTSLTGGVFKVFDATPIRTSLTVRSITTFGTGEANITWAEMGQDNATTLLSRVAPIGPFTKTTAVSIVLTYDLTQS